MIFSIMVHDPLYFEVGIVSGPKKSLQNFLGDWKYRGFETNAMTLRLKDSQLFQVFSVSVSVS